MNNEYLVGIYQYLIDQNMPNITLYKLTEHIAIYCAKFCIKIIVFGHVATVGVDTFELTFEQDFLDQFSAKQFDLSDPNSLQLIYEFVMKTYCR